MKIFFGKGAFYFLNNWDHHQSKGLLLFERKVENKFALIALNFSGDDHSINYTFEMSGDYHEQLHHEDNFLNIAQGQTKTLTIPSTLWAGVVSKELKPLKCKRIYFLS